MEKAMQILTMGAFFSLLLGVGCFSFFAVRDALTKQSTVAPWGLVFSSSMAIGFILAFVLILSLG